MWIPVELHNESARARGLREALLAHLTTYPHYKLVSGGFQDGEQLSPGSQSAARAVGELEACSIAYIGSRHMQPVAPFCGFSVAPDLGVARIEQLIDYEVLPSGRPAKKWLTNAVASILWVLFREHPEIKQVAIPLPVVEASFGEMKVKQIGGKYFAVRT